MIFYSHGTSNSKGSATLVKQHLVDNVIEVSKDTYGSFVITVIEYNGIKYTFMNIFTPTKFNENDQITFINTLQYEIALDEYENIILGGDFITVLNSCQDNNNGIVE